MTTVNDTQKMATPMNGSLSRLFNPKIVTFLLGILPQFDGSPGVQALLLSLFYIASGTALEVLTWSVRPIKCPLPSLPNVLSPEAAQLE
jgi:threonine/homoserine/homoserine lactone efflux protein